MVKTKNTMDWQIFEKLKILNAKRFVKKQKPIINTSLLII